MNTIVEFYEHCKEIREDLTLAIYYNSIKYWVVEIGFKVTSPRHDEIIFYDQNIDKNLVLSKAYVALANFMIKEYGGY